MPRESDLTIVIPVHNEAGFIGPAVREIAALADRVDPEYRIILVENGSTDATFRQVTALVTDNPQIEVLQLPSPNYGAAVRRGMQAIGGKGWVVLFDIDFFSGEFLEQVWKMWETADVVVASKRGTGSVDNRSWFRRLATWVFSGLVKFATGSRLSDTHGIKAMRSHVIEAVIGQVVRADDLFDTELVVRAERAGYRVQEVPIQVQELRPSRSSLLRRVPRTVRGLLQLRRVLRKENRP